MYFQNKRVLITGGTGSLGGTLLRRLLSGEGGMPEQITIFSRDEAKQSAMVSEYAMNPKLGEEFRRRVRFRIGDIRDYASVASVLQEADIVFNAAALKQVPSCEYFPYEAVKTNVNGAENIVRAINEQALCVETVVGISTDKACKPVNVMGMTKAIQERVFLSAGARCSQTKFVCVRYGNVLASRGSVIPLFKEQIRHGGPVTVTTREMTRFLLSLNDAVDTVFAAVQFGNSGEIFIPKIPSARIMDVAHCLIGERDVEIRTEGIRPGEKIHEILVSEEEISRTIDEGRYYVILSILKQFETRTDLQKEFSSGDVIMDKDALSSLLYDNGFLYD
jgi:FlaA1/EpsC-like NDP-sugar epimerase